MSLGSLKKMFNLNNKKIIVTGGSRGIGAGIVKLLDSLGAEIAFSYSSRKESAEQVLSQLSGRQHKIFQLNLSDEESIQMSFSSLLKEWGSVDGLVNNAGITKDQLLLRMKTDDFDQVINTNLKGSFLCCKAVLKPMVKARKGSIVNVTSVVGQMGNPGQANYAASKAGVEAFSKSLAKELGSRNIRANCVSPGFIETEMTDSLSAEQKEKMISGLVIERLGSVNDIAHAVAYLLSDVSSYITGQTIAVNGGLYM